VTCGQCGGGGTRASLPADLEGAVDQPPSRPWSLLGGSEGQASVLRACLDHGRWGWHSQGRGQRRIADRLTVALIGVRGQMTGVVERGGGEKGLSRRGSSAVLPMVAERVFLGTAATTGVPLSRQPLKTNQVGMLRMPVLTGDIGNSHRVELVRPSIGLRTPLAISSTIGATMRQGPQPWRPE